MQSDTMDLYTVLVKKNQLNQLCPIGDDED